MEPVPFRLSLTAATDDIDELGHVSNLVYLRWVLDAALAHSAAAGWDHAAYRTLGGVFVVRRHEIEYLAAVFDGDAIDVTTWVAEWRGVSCERRTSIRRARDGHEVARAATRWAFIEIATGRPRKIPDVLRVAFACDTPAP
jgi:acyl-CoA thioester hydrolase